MQKKTGQQKTAVGFAEGGFYHAAEYAIPPYELSMFKIYSARGV
jgi:hypothetical protein